MIWNFNTERGLIEVEAKVFRDGKFNNLLVALDTGATHTFIRGGQLESLGYEPSSSPNKTTVITGSDQSYVPVLPVEKLVALGREMTDLDITAMDLPPSASIDGVLGLDFLRGHILTIDFQKGEIHLR